MPLPEDLLEQARFLSSRERGKPKQASLRRAVSAAYYAVFHLLSAKAASQACPASSPGLREYVQRTLGHGTMKEVAGAFGKNQLPPRIAPLWSHPISPSLGSIARSFVRLQEERHNADYDLADQFDRARVQGLVREAAQVFLDWDTIRGTDEARVFLASMMFWKPSSK